ncbi:MAG: SpoIIE family protein phosphatase [Clostridia bacterium]|nr:SpoIIE family protein phosphatase [Clostridia bacterium]
MNQIAMLKQKKINLRGMVKVPEKKDILKTIILMVCQRATVLGGNPFGCIFFSAVCGSDTAYLSIPAIIIGALWGQAPVMKYTAAALIMYIYKLMVPEKRRKKAAVALICAGAVFLCGLYRVTASDNVAYNLMMLAVETLICAACCPVFANINDLIIQNEKNQPVSRENAVSLVIVMAVAMWGLTGITLPFSISIKSIIGIYLVLCMVMYSSIPVSASFALVCGFINSINTNEALTVAGVYAISSVFAGLMKYFGQIGAAVGFLTGITVSVLMIGDINSLSLNLIDIFITSAFFAFVPLKFHQKTGVFLSNAFRPDVPRRDFRIKEYITEELNCFSNTFSEYARQFKSTFQKSAENESSPATIFDEVSARICADCNRCADCWQKNFNDTYKYMFSILEITETTGHCDIHNAPIVFTQRCIQPELFLNEFNHVYEMSKINSLRKGEQTGERHLVSNQYSEISKIISELSEEIEGNFFFDEQKEKVIISECSKEGIYLKDINVIKNGEGYYEIFFTAAIDSETETICNICSDVMNMKLKRVYCKNDSIVKLAVDSSYRVEVTVAQKKKDDEPVSGDTVVHFETDKNKYYIILCDGMGSGTDASKESKMTCELLGGFLKAGFSKQIALSLINSTLALKMDREGFSTIDLCEIDLRSGVAEFVKIGGAQSFLKIGNECDVISSKGLPAGILEEVSTEKVTRNLSDNDLIVMVSDGVSEVGYGMMRGEWIKRLIKLDGLSDAEMADSLINSARKKVYPRTPDDMTAAVIRLHKIEEVGEELTEAI